MSLPDAVLDAMMRLYRCRDCHGTGRREHAIWPKREFTVSSVPSDLTSDTVEFEPPRIERKTCETCRGTGIYSRE